ncbi:MAG TPA: hypothetical protein VF933_32180 [Streptosporangiaceae bacterium]
MADALFEEPRLARVYDPLDPDRDDLVVYAAIAEEFGVRRVLGIGRHGHLRLSSRRPWRRRHWRGPGGRLA